MSITYIDDPNLVDDPELIVLSSGTANELNLQNNQIIVMPDVRFLYLSNTFYTGRPDINVSYFIFREVKPISLRATLTWMNILLSILKVSVVNYVDSFVNI